MAVLISRIRIAGTPSTVPIEIEPCALRDVQLWHRDIHLKFIAPKGGIGSNWDWPAIFLGSGVTEAMSGRVPLTFQIRVEAPNGMAVPVAQALFSFPYSYPGNAKGRNPHEKCVFIWFIAATPIEALNFYGIKHKFAVMAPLLDTAIQISLTQGLEGRIGLHAAAGKTSEESAELAARYAKQELLQRGKSIGFFRPFRWEDGRLFYFYPAGALA